MLSKPLAGISVIVTTYNRPDALDAVLAALAKQTQLPHEVIIADDGSTQETRQLIDQLKKKLKLPLKHVWQADEGFRAAKIRNQAVLLANYDYLIFLDGDCIPFPDFIAQHRKLAEFGWFVSGHRILLSQSISKKILERSIPIYQHSFMQWLSYYIQRNCNRLLPLLRLKLIRWRKIHPKNWRGAKSCNLALWKKDFLKVNGFDESFIGWGYEDSDLVIRLIRAGIYRKSGKFAVPVIHLWHKQYDRQQEPINFNLLKQITESQRIKAKKGIFS